MSATAQPTINIEALITAPVHGIPGVKAKAHTLEEATGLRITDYAQYGCTPGNCKCPTRFARCRMWDRFEVACREATGAPQPEPKPILNRHGQNVRGRIYASKSEALHDLYGSNCE